MTDKEIIDEDELMAVNITEAVCDQFGDWLGEPTSFDLKADIYYRVRQAQEEGKEGGQVMKCPNCGDTKLVSFNGALFQCQYCKVAEVVKDNYDELKERWKVEEVE